MYPKKQSPTNTTINRNESYVGERIEQKINRIVNNKEPIKDGAPIIYTERKDGVQPQYDIRTDRWEIAIDAMDRVHKTELAKREASIAERAKKGMEKESGQTTKDITGSEPTGGTTPPSN